MMTEAIPTLTRSLRCSVVALVGLLHVFELLDDVQDHLSVPYR